MSKIVSKLLEIAESWIIAANPTPEQSEIAEKRIKICDTCEFSRFNEAINLHYCGSCGCPLDKKIFSTKPGNEACPKGKWNI